MFKKSFIPIVLNRDLLSDQNLTDQQLRIILLAEVFRSEYEGIKNDFEAKDYLENLTASKFAIAMNKTPDHVRRLLAKMSNDEQVKKYLIIKFEIRRRQNKEDKIILQFTDQRINEIEVKENSKNFVNFAGEKVLDWGKDILLKTYLKSSKCFSNLSPTQLVKICDVEINELIQGIIYVDVMNEKKIRESGQGLINPIGYLLTCFDINGKFKYKLKPFRYLKPNTKLTSESNVEYELDKASFNLFCNKMNSDFDNTLKYHFRETDNLIFLKAITKAGKKLNPVVWLKRVNVNFKIIESLIGSE